MRVLVLTTVMAPYRVQLFSEIGKQCDLYVCFEQMRSAGRDEKWYDKETANFQLVRLKKWEAPLRTVKTDIIKHVRDIHPDIIIAYEYHTNTSLFLLSYCQIMNIPYIINCDGAFVSKSIKDIVKRFYISRASGFISSGQMADKYLLHYGAGKNRIYHNHFTSLHENDILETLPSSEVKALTRKEKGISEKQIVLSIGQFIYRKGYDILLNAAAHLSDDVGIYIIGGEVTSEYKKMVADLNLKNVHFLDFMEPGELKYYFLSADLFVLPTREDVWGLVINEAMGFGLPIVTTDRCIAGIEMIKNGVNGFIVPIEDSVLLYEAMHKVLADEQLKIDMGNENLKIIKAYTYEKSALDITYAIRNAFALNQKRGKE